jgi:hypothetical protein
MATVKITLHVSTQTQTQTQTQLEPYFSILRKGIPPLMKTKKKLSILDDILLNNFIEKNREAFRMTHVIKRVQMTIGRVWQFVIGNYDTFRDLKTGDSTGLDVVSDDRKIIMEIKNRHNTDNTSSEKTNLSKLATFKKNRPDYECVYGVINDRSERGEHKLFTHDGVQLEYYSGQCLFDHVFGVHRAEVISFVKDLVTTELSLIT